MLKRLFQKLFHKHKHTWRLHSHDCSEVLLRRWAASATLECVVCKKRRYVQKGNDGYKISSKLPSKQACIVWLRAQVEDETPDYLPEEFINENK